MRSLILFLLVYGVVLIQAAVIPVFLPNALIANVFVVLTVNLALFRKNGELIFWTFLLGFLIDSLSAFPLGFNMVLLPLLAIFSKYLLRKFWGHASVFSAVVLTGFSVAAYQVIALLVKALLGRRGKGATDDLLASLSFAPASMAISLFVNCFLITPLFYLLLKSLNELFEYWDQKRKI